MKKFILSMIVCACALINQAMAGYTFDIEPTGNYYQDEFGSVWGEFYGFKITNAKPMTGFSEVSCYFPEKVSIPWAAIRRGYYYEDPNDGYVEGIARGLSLGSVFECLKEIDIYDRQFKSEVQHS